MCGLAPERACSGLDAYRDGTDSATDLLRAGRHRQRAVFPDRSCVLCPRGFPSGGRKSRRQSAAPAGREGPHAGPVHGDSQTCWKKPWIRCPPIPLIWGSIWVRKNRTSGQWIARDLPFIPCRSKVQIGQLIDQFNEALRSGKTDATSLGRHLFQVLFEELPARFHATLALVFGSG